MRAADRELAIVFRSSYRSIYLLLLLLAATVDGRIRRPRVGAEGAIWIHGWCRRIVEALQIECSYEGMLPQGCAVISNHLSYLDILLYSATTPFIMVAKHELRSWPLLGWLTARAGTVYVQRSEDVRPGETRQSYAEVNRMMSEAYASGLPVLFFPEGTTTDGAQVLPFRRGLFHSVLNGKVPLRTAALRFQLRTGDASHVGENVCFTDDAVFAPHLFRCLGLHGLRARIRFGDEVQAREDRFILSGSAHTQVSELYAELLDAQDSKVAAAMDLGYEVCAAEALQNLLDRPVE